MERTNCRKVCAKLSAYIDNEVSDRERQAISSHVASCEKCSAELKLLTDNDIYIRQVKQVSPAVDFRAQFWERLRKDDSIVIQRGTIWETLIRRWVPIPLACSLLIVVFSAFTVLSLLVYAVPGADNASVTRLVRKCFAGFSGKNTFGPANFADFCNDCHEMLCMCCGNGTGSACPMKGGKTND